MILNLYGVDGLVFQTLASGFREAHLENKLKFEVVEAKKVGSKFKEAVKKAYNAKFLDDADMIIRFAEPKSEEMAPATGAPVEEPAQEAPAPQEEPVEEPAEEPVEEPVEEPAQEEPVEEPTEEEPAEEEPKKGKKQKVDEAETTATGADLKKKILDTVKRRLFKEGDDTVELSDLDGFLEGYNVSFIKIALKEATKNAGDGNADEEPGEGGESEEKEEPEKDDSESKDEEK